MAKKLACELIKRKKQTAKNINISIAQ